MEQPMIDTPNQPPPSAAQEQQQRILMQQALRGPIPRFYANQCLVAQTSSDLSIVMTSNGVPGGTLSMSYETAKSLVRDLAKTISNFENATGREVQTIEEISLAMAKIMGGTNATKL
jgi:hypothetical protein